MEEWGTLSVLGGSWGGAKRHVHPMRVPHLRCCSLCLAPRSLSALGLQHGFFTNLHRKQWAWQQRETHEKSEHKKNPADQAWKAMKRQ